MLGSDDESERWMRELGRAGLPPLEPPQPLRRDWVRAWARIAALLSPSELARILRLRDRIEQGEYTQDRTTEQMRRFWFVRWLVASGRLHEDL